MSAAASSNFSEDALVEQPAIALFEALGWEYANCFHEFEHLGVSPLGRENKSEVVLFRRLRLALQSLNPELPDQAFDQAIEELTRDRSAMSLLQANREIYDLIKNGVKAIIPRVNGRGDTIERVRVVDWNEPHKNDFFLASQFWVTGEMYARRADLVGFINGLPLLFIELKATHKRLETAYRRNLTDYKQSIPQLFWYNGLIVLSNGSQSRVGSVTAAWEHFGEWKKINSEGEEGVVSLETTIRGTCDPARLLDLVENFTLFMEARRGLIKILAKNHQYLGVNAAIDALQDRVTAEGRLGVFWHTQGSGKSISMIFFSQKVLRSLPGNWTFVVVTDRTELDEQIYKNFASTGVVTEKRAQATSSAHLRRLLREDHRYVFTLIQKFLTRTGETHPVLSGRSDIVVMTDEAHRSQYDTLAMNMRTALPNASYIAFTGTPLMVGEEKTREVFGPYVSIYNFKESVDDGATVPLYYENRIPEVQLTNEQLNEDMERLLEEAELDADEEKMVERQFSRQYHIITRDDRLETIAEDIVAHFMGRGYRGKAMVVSIDKATAVKMYDKVQKHWKAYLDRLTIQLASAPEEEREGIEDSIRYMEETDMAVVVSQSQNEIPELQRKGADIVPHRRRMVTEDLDTKFKDPDDPFRIVFVCAMWMTGFDVPCCTTIYLDKPMRNHTLMQTIARANRVFGEKVNGLIVDYVGIFRDLQRALAIYGSDAGGGVKPGDTPVKDKSALVDELKGAIEEATDFCAERGIDLEAIEAAEAFERIKLLDDAVDSLVVSDDSKARYLLLAANVSKLFKAILPDPMAKHLAPRCALLRIMALKIRSLDPEVDISEFMQEVEDLLDRSIAAEGYVIREPPGEYEAEHVVDLSQIDFEALKSKFERQRKHTEAEKLRGAVNAKLRRMVRLNRTRMNYLEQLQALIDEYNGGRISVDQFFSRLVALAQTLNEEEQRAVIEKLSEEELAVFDLLIKPHVRLSNKEREQAKTVAHDLLETLKREKLVLDWRKRQQSRAAVRLAIEETLDRLPDAYSQDLYVEKCTTVYHHVYESYYGEGRSVYSVAA